MQAPRVQWQNYQNITEVYCKHTEWFVRMASFLLKWECRSWKQNAGYKHKSTAQELINRTKRIWDILIKARKAIGDESLADLLSAEIGDARTGIVATELELALKQTWWVQKIQT